MECPACGSLACDDSSATRPTAAPYKLRRCRDCGTEFALPRVPATSESYAMMGEYYGWRWEFDQCLMKLGAVMRSGKVLEIGCGEGLFLDRLRRQGFTTVGADLNSQAIRRARERGLDAVEGGIEELARTVGEASCDAIALFHVLEHVPDPITLLRALVCLLRPGGWCFISVPNPNRASAMVVSECWDDPPHHLTRFSLSGFTRLLTRSGIELIETRSEPLDITPYQLASLRADAVAFPSGDANKVSWPMRYIRKLGPFLASLPGAVNACRVGTGTAMYAAGRRPDVHAA